MRILVEDIPKEGIKLDFDLPPEWMRERIEDPGDDFRFAENIGVWVELYRTERGIRVKGGYSSVAQLTCPKCLEEFTSPFEGEFDIRLMPDIYIAGKREVRLTRKDLDVEYFDGVVVDLENIILSELMVNFPHDKLCRPDCKGLCPVCGANWNYEKCEHYGAEHRYKNPIWDKIKLSIKL